MRYARLSVRSGGFTLIEVMVAVLVICVGLLGIAKMEALALSNANTSRLRSLAAIEAASLASGMHSNRLYWGGNNPPATVTVVPNNSTAVSSSDATLQAQAVTDLGLSNPMLACVGSSSSGSMCTPIQLAASDVVNWNLSLKALLPNPSAAIACAGGPPPSCTIQIQWAENAVAISSSSANPNELGGWSAGAFAVPTYLLYVEP